PRCRSSPRARRVAGWSGLSTCCRTNLPLMSRDRPGKPCQPCTGRSRLLLRDLTHRAVSSPALTMAACVRLAPHSRRRHAREEHAMKGADKVICQAAAVLLLFSIASSPAKAQFLGGSGGAGGEDMMTQMAPMLEMMKAKMGKRRFAAMMQTMGPMMSRMMEGGGGGFGGGIPTGFGGGYGGGNIMGMLGSAGGGELM